jgi:hypothetical protein
MAFVGDAGPARAAALGPREPASGAAAGAVLARGALDGLAMVLAFVVGLLADGLAGSRHINLLAPPMWGVLAWNVVRLPRLVVWPLVQLAAANRDHRGPIVRGVAERIRRRIRLPRLTAGSSARRLHRFAALWLERSRGLATRRAETLLHAAAPRSRSA